MTDVIRTRGLAKRYRQVTALHDCAITLPEGRISALIGPNGASKTTLLRLLAGLAQPDPDWESTDVGLEEMVLGYMSQDAGPAISLAVTLAGFIAARAAIALWLRPHYMSAITVFYQVTGGYTPPGSYWQLASGVLDANGQPVPQPNGPAAYGIPLGYLAPSCAPLNGGATKIAPSCAQALARFRGFITYQPAGRYWAFQGIKTGIFAILAAILLMVAAVVLLRRDA